MSWTALEVFIPCFAPCENAVIHDVLQNYDLNPKEVSPSFSFGVVSR
jgi:hypothetical protein